jgi:hypothetical protein
VIVTRPSEIQDRIKSLSVDVRHYTFWGRSGSYFRYYPLHQLDKQSRLQKLITDVEVVLPNPTDARLTKSYNEIITSLGEKPGKNLLLANVLATSMACAIVSANNKYIKINLYYSNFLPAFRVDISENGAILTQDDPAKSALFFESGSEFYEMFRTTIRNEMRISRQVVWDESLFAGRTLSKESCDKKTLTAFGIEVTEEDELQQQVAKLLTEKSHRYT